VSVSPLVILHPEQPPSPRYYELTFPSQSSLRPNNAGRPLPLSSISFRNYYVYAVTIKQLCRIPRSLHDAFSPPNPTSSPKDPLAAPPGMYWKTVLQNRPLMQDPHSERDSQGFVTIDASEFSQDPLAPAENSPQLPPLRIFLLQPSPLWKAFELKGISAQVGRASSGAPVFSPLQTEGNPSSYAAGERGGGGWVSGEPRTTEVAGGAALTKSASGVASLGQAYGAGVARRDEKTAAQSEQQIGAVLDELSRELGKQIKMIRSGGV
jgi:hypothetical protein